MKIRILVSALLITSLLNPIAASAELKLIDYPVCAESGKAPCIESLILEDDQGKQTEAIPEGPTYKMPSEFAGLKSDPATVWQWRTPGIKHESKTELLTVKAWHFPLGAQYCWGPGLCSSDIDETIINISASGWDAPVPNIDFPDLDNDRVCESNGIKDFCKRTWGINKNYRYVITLKVADDFAFSYSNGEALDGSARIIKNTKGERLLVFGGKPVDYSYKLTIPNRTSDQQRADVTLANLGVYVQTKKSTNSSWLSRCDKGEGLSLWYSGQLKSYPSWIAKDSALTIQVESTHLKSDNSQNVGSFNIDMPLSTATCLWGVDLSKAVSATISASYPELGISEVVTTVSQVKDGFFKVSAAGFHYSAPVIKMKVAQSATSQPVTPMEASPSPTASVDPAAIPAAQKIKKSTITCVKGKTTKKISAVNPKCPAGYKKK
jgi:hypothetical protein